MMVLAHGRSLADRPYAAALVEGRDALGDGERPPRHVCMEQFDHFSVELNDALAGVLGQSESVDDGAGGLDLCGGRRINLVADVDLAWMNERLAVEAHFASLQAFGVKAVEILDVVIDAIDDVEPVSSRGDDAVGEPCGHRGASGRQPGARLLGEVVEAHDEHREPRGRIACDGGDRTGVEDGVRRLHHRPDAGRVRRAVLAHHSGGQHDRPRSVDLGQENGVRPGRGGGDKVLRAPWRMRPIDPDDHLAPAEIAPDRPDHLRPSLHLGVGRNRILEIEDQRVGGQRRRLGQGLGVGAGHIEDAATRVNEHDNLLAIPVGI